MYAPEPAIATCPTEILYHIARQLSGADQGLDPYSYLFENLPASICRVNKHWNTVLTPLLYSHYRFTSHPRQTKSLWLLLRTIVNRPELGELFRQLSLFNGDYDEPFETDDWSFFTGIKALYTENQQWLEHAFTQVGWDNLPSTKPWVQNLYPTGTSQSRDELLAQEATEMLCDAIDPEVNMNVLSRKSPLVIRSYQDDYHQPLLALLCAYAPNVLALNLQAYPSDRFLEDILCRATYGAADQSVAPLTAFQHLEELSLAPTCYNCLPDAEKFIRTHIGAERPYYMLPRLKTFHALQAHTSFLQYSDESDSDGAFDTEIKHTSSIEKLTIGMTVNTYSLETLLSTMPNLLHLSITLPSHSSAEYGPALHQRIWDALLPYKSRLQYLEIYQDKFDTLFQGQLFPDANDPENPIVVCPPLSEFTALEHLNTTPMILAGYNCEHYEPLKCKSHLPPNLVSLGLYMENMFYLMDYFNNFEAELANLADTKPPLAAITIDTAEIDMGVDANDDTRFPPLLSLRLAATRNNILLTEDGNKHLFFGGYETPFMDWSHRIYKFLDDGRIRNRLYEKKAADVIPWPLEEYHSGGLLPGSRKRPAPREVWERHSRVRVGG